jgi:hypothetical protein
MVRSNWRTTSAKALTTVMAILLPVPRSVKLRKLATAVFTATGAVWALARIAVSRLSPVILMLPKAVPPEPVDRIVM